MALVSATVKVNPGVDKLSASLRLTPKDIDAALKAADDVVRQLWFENFATGGKSGGEPWAPLKASTLKRKAKAGYGATILVATGGLRDAMSNTGGDHVAAAETIGSVTRLEFGLKGESERKGSEAFIGSKYREPRNPFQLLPRSEVLVADAIRDAVNAAIRERLSLSVVSA